MSKNMQSRQRTNKMKRIEIKNNYNKNIKKFAKKLTILIKFIFIHEAPLATK